jgi:hypothetical protein
MLMGFVHIHVGWHGKGIKWLVLEDSFLKWTRQCHTMMSDLKPKKLDKSEEVGTCHPMLIIFFLFRFEVPHKQHTSNSRDCFCC